ncbi:hypothetical protein [Phytohabitans houttuyneae]|nr:hypothetical protein [Phytohabitans houttuyneae]
MTDSTFSDDVQTSDSETPDSETSADTSGFNAVCETGHQWFGPRRTGSDAWEKAQADANAHNEELPGHQAGVIP